MSFVFGVRLRAAGQVSGHPGYHLQRRERSLVHFEGYLLTFTSRANPAEDTHLQHTHTHTQSPPGCRSG